MFDAATLADFVSRFANRLPRQEVERVARWIEDRQAAGDLFSNPNAVLEATLKRKAKAAANAPRAVAVVRQDDRPFVGFDETGSCVRSATPVTNPQTDFARWLIREMRDQLLSPADVVKLVRQRDKAIWQAIGLESNLRPWAMHAHYAHDEHGNPVRVERECDLSCWPCLTATSGLAEAIRSFGGWYPWANDRNAWLAMLEREASRRPAACRAKSVSLSGLAHRVAL